MKTGIILICTVLAAALSCGNGSFLDMAKGDGRGDGISVTGISLNKSQTVVLAGSTEQLIAAILPFDASNKKVIWTTSDETKATVSIDGIVTGITEGTADITATADDGKFETVCSVSVYNTIPSPPDGLITQNTEVDEIYEVSAIIIDSKNKYNIIYNIKKGNDPYTYSIHHIYYDGVSWVDNVVTNNGCMGYERGFTKSNNSDELYLGYLDYSTWDLRYAHYKSNSWNNYFVWGGYSQFGVVSMKVDGNEKLHFTHRIGLNTLYYYGNKSGSFLRTSLDDPVTGSHELLIDEENDAHVLYAQRWDYVRYVNDTNWSNNVAISGSAPVDCGRNPAGVVYNNKIYAIYDWATDASYNQSNLYQVSNSSGSWQTSTIVLNVNLIYSRKLLFDDPNNMHIVCTMKGNQLNLYTNRSGGWKGYSLLSSGVGNYINAYKVDNKISIVYIDDSNKKLNLKTIGITDYN